MVFLSLMSQIKFLNAKLFFKGEDLDANGKMDFNIYYNSSKIIAMYIAVLNNNIKGIQLLLKYGADKEFKLEDG